MSKEAEEIIPVNRLQSHRKQDDPSVERSTSAYTGESIGITETDILNGLFPATERETEHLQRVIEFGTVEQRTVLGFLKPGDRYWTAEMLAAVQRRYPKMDLKPYKGKP